VSYAHARMEYGRIGEMPIQLVHGIFSVCQNVGSSLTCNVSGVALAKSLVVQEKDGKHEHTQITS